MELLPRRSDKASDVALCHCFTSYRQIFNKSTWRLHFARDAPIKFGVGGRPIAHG